MSPSTETRTPIPATHVDLLGQPLIAHLATLRPDGSPQSNPVWFAWDGTELRISQTCDREKMHNIEHDMRVAMSVTDPDDPYRYLEVRGVVAEVEPDADRRFIDDLSDRYLDRRPYPHHQPGDERVVVHIRSVATSSMG